MLATLDTALLNPYLPPTVSTVTTPMRSDFLRILENITARVPAPAPPPSRPTRTFRTLRPGDRLSDPTGTVHTITACTNRGVTCDTGTRVDQWPREGWTRLRRPRARKAS